MREGETRQNPKRRRPNQGEKIKKGEGGLAGGGAPSDQSQTWQNSHFSPKKAGKHDYKKMKVSIRGGNQWEKDKGGKGRLRKTGKTF